MSPSPDIFAAGLPACGKSHFGEWLAETHGYRHIDFEKQLEFLNGEFIGEMKSFRQEKSPKPLIDTLKRDGQPLYFNWGFPIEYLQAASRLAHLLLPVWFYADEKLARKSFIQRGGGFVDDFNKQSKSILDQAAAMDSIFGANTIKSITADGRISPEAIWSEIQKFTAASLG